ncbi:MAG: hypothetical protein DME96_09870 [Verrucomicrobia bacterium]|nr:MAG: hypothetical protein DME96_09870 [Verrucomicrobiota bacterium]
MASEVRELCQWGLVPAWAKDPAMGNQMINARPEMLAVKPSLDRSLDVIETYPIRMRWTKMLQNGSSLYFKVFFGI